MIFSSSPVVYWIAALLTTPSEDDLLPVQHDLETIENTREMRRKVSFLCNFFLSFDSVVIRLSCRFNKSADGMINFLFVIPGLVQSGARSQSRYPALNDIVPGDGWI